MQVRVRGTFKSYGTSLWFPRLVILVMNWAVSLSQGVVGLEGSGTLDSFLFDCSEFVGCPVISLGEWRKAVSRIAAPRGPVLDHQGYSSEGLVLSPSGDA